MIFSAEINLSDLKSSALFLVNIFALNMIFNYFLNYLIKIAIVELYFFKVIETNIKFFIKNKLGIKKNKRHLGIAPRT